MSVNLGQIFKNMGKFRKNGENLGKIGKTWEIWENLGVIWEILGNLGTIWENLGNLGKFGKFRITNFFFLLMSCPRSCPSVNTIGDMMLLHGRIE
jgi:hypothetical protein